MAAAAAVTGASTALPPPRVPSLALPASAATAIALIQIYPCLAILWVAGATLTAVAVADLAWEGGAWGRGFPVVGKLLEVSEGCLLGFVLILLALLLVWRLALLLLTAPASADSKIPGPSIWMLLREPAVLGCLATLPFLLLIVVDATVMAVLTPAKGSQVYRICSLVIDVGVLGSMPILCLVTIPSLALKLWRTWPGGQGDAPADISM